MTGWDLLGLGRRGGSVVIGTEGVRAALKSESLALVIVASDRGERIEQKVERLAIARGVRLIPGPRAVELGRTVGRGPVHSVGVRDPRLAEAIAARVTTEAL